MQLIKYNQKLINSPTGTKTGIGEQQKCYSYNTVKFILLKTVLSKFTSTASFGMSSGAALRDILLGVGASIESSYELLQYSWFDQS